MAPGDKGMNMKKIVVLNGYVVNPGDLSWHDLSELGELVVYDRTALDDEEETIAHLAGAHIAITNKTPITKTVIDACPNLQFISTLATGYNVVDCDYAKQKGIPVSNIPTYGTMSVAQHAIAMLLEITNRVEHHSKTVHEGKWAQSRDWCYWDYPLIELADKTLGVIGFGRIGQQVGRIAKALGMQVLAYDEYPNNYGREVGKYVDLDTLLARSDVISLHCPLFPSTEGIINRNTIAKMKDGVILLNDSRGPLIREEDLADALNSGKIYAAGLDVVSVEPIEETNPLLRAPNCFITPHIAWAPIESRRRMIEATVQNVRAYLDGAPINVVNA